MRGSAVWGLSPVCPAVALSSAPVGWLSNTKVSVSYVSNLFSPLSLPFRMAIQVDKFDFDTLPQPDQEALRYTNPKLLEEERLHAQASMINSTLGITWNIISFVVGCIQNPIRRHLNASSGGPLARVCACSTALTDGRTYGRMCLQPWALKKR